jgi:ribosomal protein S27E
MTESNIDRKAACSVKSAPVPLEVSCPGCSTEIEIWSDETETTCGNCGSTVYTLDGNTAAQ